MSHQMSPLRQRMIDDMKIRNMLSSDPTRAGGAKTPLSLKSRPKPDLKSNIQVSEYHYAGIFKLVNIITQANGHQQVL